MTTIGDLLAIFATTDIAKRRSFDTQGDSETQKVAKTPSRIFKRPVCTPCREGRHEACAAIVDERDTTPEGEVREWEEPCACDAPACAYDLAEYEQGRKDMHAEDENDD